MELQGVLPGVSRPVRIGMAVVIQAAGSNSGQLRQVSLR